jgi:antitoxin ParD1/3/4
MNLGEKLDGFVARQVASGKYATASEVMRAGLRKLMRAEQRAEYEARIVDEALAEGLSPRTHEEIVAECRARAAVARANGKT